MKLTLAIFILFACTARARQRPASQEAGGSLFIHQQSSAAQQASRSGQQANQNARTVAAVQPHRSLASANATGVSLSGHQAATNQQASFAGVRQRWRHMEQSISDDLRLKASSLRRVLFDELLGGSSMRNASAPVVVAPKCKLALADLLSGLEESQLWAVRMLDAGAHSALPSGLLEGTLTELGNFDECLSVVGGDNAYGGSQVVGQYCTLLIKPALIQRPRLHTACRRLPNLSSALANLSTHSREQNVFNLFAQNSHQFFYAGLRLGVCAPSACKRSDLQALLGAYLARYELLGQVKGCQTRQQSAWISEHELQELPSVAKGEQWDLFANLIGLRLDLTQQCIVLLRERAKQNFLHRLVFALLLLLTIVGTFLHKDDKEEEAKNRSGAELCCRCLRSARSRWQHRYNITSASTITLMDGTGASGEVHSCALECPPSPASQLPGLQHNPLANFSVASTSEYDTFQQMSIDISPPTATEAGYESPMLAAAAAIAATPHKSTGASGGVALPATLLGPSSGKRRAECSIARHFFTCFSLKSSLRSIVGSGSSGGDCNNDDIKVIQGLRTITMVWIIFGHSIGLVSPEMMNNLFDLSRLSCSSRFLQALLNATLAVDTFFMISGLVTVVSIARKCTSARNLLPMRGQQTALSSGGGGAVFKAQSDESLFASSIANSASLSSSTSLSGASNCEAANQADKQRQQQQKQKKSSTSSSSSSSSSGSSCSIRANKKLLADELMKQQKHQATWPADLRPIVWLLMRYLRLTPSYAVIIGLSILLPSLGAPGGPFWQETMGQLEPACRANWWANLLYVNNFYETDKLCLIHSWYLSNDCQFFIVALILLAVMYKSRKFCLLLLVTLFMASTAATFALIVANEFPPTIVTTSPAVAERWQFIHSLYYKPWPHLPAYLVGLVVGYLILIKQQSDSGDKSLSTFSGWRATCWLLFGCISLALLSSIYPWNMGLQVEPLIAGLHGATFRTLWAACMGWLVFALVGAPPDGDRRRKPKSSLGQLLGWRGFRLTSRLTYCAYLVHPLVIYYHFGTLRERMDSSLYGQLFRFLATLALSYLCALALSLLVESPSIKLQRLIVEVIKRNQTSNSAKPLEGHFIVSDWASAKRPAKVSGTTSSGASSSAPLYAAERQLSKSGGERIKARKRKNSCSRASQHLQDLSVSMASRESSQTCSNSSSSAIDEEFQRKLAQAIGRGFKIRSKLASGATERSNGNKKQLRSQQQQALIQPSPRLVATKKLPPPVTTRKAEFVPVFSEHLHGGSRAKLEPSLETTPPPPPPPPPPRSPTKLARRGESFSTFLPVQSREQMN